MRELLVAGFCTIAFFISNGAVQAEEWYERPEEHLTIAMDSATRVFEGTVVRGTDTILCGLEIMAKWPQVASGPSREVVDSLSAFFLRFANSQFDLAPGTTLQERVDAELDTIVGNEWYDRSMWGGALWILEVAYLDHRILSLRVSRDVCISCNGHPYRENYYHFALPELREISQDSIFIADAQPYLDSIGALAFRRDQKIPDDTTFRQAGYDIDENTQGKYAFPKFALCPNYQITDSGIVYVYNAYEIASGAYGMSTAYLSWQQLQPFIRPDGPLGWVLKEE
ncbi:MAG: DUF3298 domain-containing protein [bacterium]|nr:DUF3298 domain-containing protein [bacterium]